MALSALPKGNSRARTASMDSVLIGVTGFDFVDSKKRTSNPGDRVRGVLLRDFLGIKAEFDPETNAPITEVAITLPLPTEEQKKATFQRHEILDKYNGKGQSPAVMPTGVLAGDRCKIVSNVQGEIPVLEANWLNTWSAKDEPEIQIVCANRLVQIGKEMKRKDGDGTYQSVVIIEDQLSRKFTTVEEFRENAIALLTWIDSEADFPQMPGSPGVRIRAVEIDEKGEPFPAIIDCANSYDSDAKRVRTPEEMVDAFIAENEAWMGEIRENGSTTHFEVMPISRLSTGSQSLPTARAAGDKRGKTAAEFDEGINICGFPVVVEDPKTKEKKTYINTGVARVDYMGRRIKLREPDPDTGRTMTPWFGTNVSRIGLSKIYERAEFPSPVLPKEFADKFEDAARQRGKDMYAYKNPKEAAPAEAPAPEEAAAPRP